MKRAPKSAATALLVLAGVLMLAAIAFTSDARSRLAATRIHRRALASMEASLARLSAYEEAEARLASAGTLPNEIPLPVSVPSPASLNRETTTSPGGWTAATFDLHWDAPAKAALEALAALCNLDATWHIDAFSLKPSAGGASLDVRISTARPATSGTGE
jgi:hypothetical protein